MKTIEYNTKMNKGFTLIELLVVIATIGVLAAVVLLAINPAEILRRSRDATRLQDLATIRKAIDAAIAQNTSLTTLPCQGTTGSSSSGERSPRGTGWIGSAGCGSGSSSTDLSAFIAVLPIDPVNASTSVACNSGSNCTSNRTTAEAYYYFSSDANMNYELNCYLESTQNLTRLSGDGGNNNNRFETGTHPGLGLIN